jgi:2-polyprenyl-3-methyl-5-hydroxy-6-metoxy-1,4-benzoquinol methylase
LNSSLELARLKAAKASKGTSTEPIYRVILERIGKLDVTGRVLDFGAGTGYLTKAMYESGRFSSVDAIDIVAHTDPDDSRITWICSDLNEAVSVPAASYDLVVAAEVIEHLENPRFLAREWFRLLKPGGTLIVSTPNNESWRSLLSLVIRGHFAAFTETSYPAHITALVRKDFERILYEAGFEQIGFTFTDDGAVPKLTAYTWQRASLNFLKGLRYSDNIVCTAQKPIEIKKGSF